MLNIRMRYIVALFWLGFFSVTASASLFIPVMSTNGSGKCLGVVQADDTIYGVLFTPKLKGLPPGIHGFHVHECAMCLDQGMAAGRHLDLAGTGLHRGPYKGNSHTGDLPVLVVGTNGKAVLPVLAPRLKLDQIKGRALLIDAGEDNYGDSPQRNGGGLPHLACGEIPYH